MSEEWYDYKKIKMVQWLSPGVLIKSGLKAIISTLFGKYADRRILDSIRAVIKEFDYSKQDEIWIDYVADLGDGFNSTYSVAHQLSQPELILNNLSQEYRTKRGQITIMGGDQVYPTATREEYQKRTVFPYACALPRSEQPNPPHLFAIPGNHDWYDGLQSFHRLFCQERRIGDRKTLQKHSYFYLKLPGNWHLFGLDIQLNSDIDLPQKKYFLELICKLSVDDKVILCIAEPFWYLEAAGHDKEHRSLNFIEEKIIEQIKKPCQIYLAGDLHHYHRYESNDGKKRQKIIAGGGGAFLHATHMPLVKKLPARPIDQVDYIEKKAYPEAEKSRRRSYRNLAFLYDNTAVSAILGFFTLGLNWLLYKDVGSKLTELSLSLSNLPLALYEVLMATLKSMPTSLFTAFLIFCFMLFADAMAGKKRFLLGLLHSFIHLLSSFLIGWFTAHCLLNFGIESELMNLLVGGTMIFALGTIISGTIFGIYLCLCSNLLGVHTEESFSSIPTEDYKSFLRIHINKSGELHIYPIAIERVCKKWKLENQTSHSSTGEKLPRIAPDEKLECTLIEDRIEL